MTAYRRIVAVAGLALWLMFAMIPALQAIQLREHRVAGPACSSEELFAARDPDLRRLCRGTDRGATEVGMTVAEPGSVRLPVVVGAAVGVSALVALASFALRRSRRPEVLERRLDGATTIGAR